MSGSTTSVPNKKRAKKTLQGRKVATVAMLWQTAAAGDAGVATERASACGMLQGGVGGDNSDVMEEEPAEPEHGHSGGGGGDEEEEGGRLRFVPATLTMESGATVAAVVVAAAAAGSRALNLATLVFSARVGAPAAATRFCMNTKGWGKQWKKGYA